MMKQQTLTGFERCAKTTRRAQFLADMHVIVPWAELTAVVEPFYPKISEAGGRPPLPLERMLRVYFLQLWFNLSDPAVEEALYESTSMRNFAGIDLGIARRKAKTFPRKRAVASTENEIPLPYPSLASVFQTFPR
jgi:IS5 family transposase